MPRSTGSAAEPSVGFRRHTFLPRTRSRLSAMADETLGRIMKEIQANIHCECMYVYGSRGRGTAKEGKSDYDLLVVASLRSILASIGRTPKLRRALDASSSVPVDITLIASSSVPRLKNALPLMVWSQSARLVYGKRDILRDSLVGSFAPSEMSAFYLSCHEAKWFLRFIKMDRSFNVSIGREGLVKLSRFLNEEILSGARSVRGLQDFASSISIEAKKESCDPATVCGLFAHYLEGIRGRFVGGDPRSALSYVGLTVSILAEMFHFGTYAAPRGRTTQLQMIDALVCFYRSMETKPPNVDLLRRASGLLNASFATRRSPPELATAENYPSALWAQVRARLRGREWDALMDFPFGTFVLHRPFPIVLA